MNTELDVCSAAVDRLFTGIEARLRVGRNVLCGALDESGLTVRNVDAAIRPVAEWLLRSCCVSGVGFAGVSGAIVDSGQDAMWWVVDETRMIIKRDELRAADYAQFEWLSTPARTKRSHVTGPYVDTVCAVNYVMTCSVPVVVDGEVVGIVGADITVEAVERSLLAELAVAGVTLVNQRGRVVLSSDPRVSTGDLIPLADARDLRQCGSFPLYVASVRREVSAAGTG